MKIYYLLLLGLFVPSIFFSQCPQAVIQCGSTTSLTGGGPNSSFTVNCDSVCGFESSQYFSGWGGPSTVIWQVSGAFSNSNPGDPTLDVVWGGGPYGTILLTVQDLQGNCTPSTDTAYVFIGAAPNPAIIGPAEVCLGDLFFYSTAPTNGQFSWDAGQGGNILNGANNPNITYEWTQSGQHQLCVTELNITSGCEASACHDVQVNSSFPFQISGEDTICANDTTVYCVNNDPNDIHYWQVGGGTIVNGQSSDCITIVWGSSGGTKSIQNYIQNSLTGCDTTVIRYVEVLDLPIPQITGLDSVIMGECHVYSSPNVQGNLFNWTVFNGQINSGQASSSIEVCWGNQGVGEVCLLEENISFGCKTNICVPQGVHIGALPSLNCPVAQIVCLSSNRSILGGSSTDCDVVCEGGSGIFSMVHTFPGVYSWGIHGDSSHHPVGEDSIMVNWANGSSGSVFLHVVDSSGACLASVDTFEVEIQAYPEISIGLEPHLCLSDSEYHYSIDSVEDGEYHWEVFQGEIMGADSLHEVWVKWDQLGESQLCVQAISPAGCASYLCDSTDIISLPDPVIMDKDSICMNELSEFCSGGGDGVSYFWTIPSGDIVSGEQDSCVQALFDSSGIMSVSLELTDNQYGCSQSTELDFLVLDLPTLEITGDTHVIEDTNGVWYSLANPHDFSSIQWTVSGGVISGNSTSDSVSVIWENPGQGQVCIEVSSLVNCLMESCQSIGIDSIPTPINTDENLEEVFSLYPNPFNDQLVLTQRGKSIRNIEYSLFDIKGQLITENTITQSTGDFIIGGLGWVEKGFYILKVNSSSGQFFFKLNKF